MRGIEENWGYYAVVPWIGVCEGFEGLIWAPEIMVLIVVVV